jgi:hypothetical protein
MTIQAIDEPLEPLVLSGIVLRAEKESQAREDQLKVGQTQFEGSILSMASRAWLVVVSARDAVVHILDFGGAVCTKTAIGVNGW